MFRLNIHKAFIIEQLVLKAGEKMPHHKQNYFALIFVDEGKGLCNINQVNVPYKKGDVFLVAPEDEHFENIQEDTMVTIIRFTELFFSGKSSLPDRTLWLRHIEPFLHHPNLIPGVAINDEDDLKDVWYAKEHLLREYREEKEFHLNIISNSVSSILSIIARNIVKNYKLDDGMEPTIYINKADKVLAYIRKNIYNSELMKIENLADEFNMSPNYINTFFKNETGETIRQYILNYKLMVTEFRLKYTNSSISEIAYQVGFSDESHLSKVFKKKHNMTPKEYRDTYTPFPDHNTNSE